MYQDWFHWQCEYYVENAGGGPCGTCTVADELLSRHGISGIDSVCISGDGWAATTLDDYKRVTGGCQSFEASDKARKEVEAEQRFIEERRKEM